MAYKGQISKIIKLGKDIIYEPYRSVNARKVNSKKKPNGYLYVLNIENTSHYKIGVSSNPKRRISDIRSSCPYNIDILFLEFYSHVYELEGMIHEELKNNEMRHEWFDLDSDKFKSLNTILKELKSIELD